jgi:hypothetical protein
MTFPGSTKRRLRQLVINGAVPLLLVCSGLYDTQFQVASLSGRRTEELSQLPNGFTQVRAWSVNPNIFEDHFFVILTAALGLDTPGSSCMGILSVAPSEEEWNNIAEEELTRDESSLSISVKEMIWLPRAATTAAIKRGKVKTQRATVLVASPYKHQLAEARTGSRESKWIILILASGKKQTKRNFTLWSIQSVQSVQYLQWWRSLVLWNVSKELRWRYSAYDTSALGKLKLRWG